MFRTSIVDVAFRSCGQKVNSACHGGNWKTRWRTPAVRETVKLKKDAFQTWFSQDSPEAADRHGVVKKAKALVVAAARTWAWEVFSDAMTFG